MFKLTEGQIKKAVDWWSKQIDDPKFSGLSPEEREDPKNDSYQLAEMMATVTARSVTITPEQFEDFKGALADALRDENYNPRFGLRVDYGPDPKLGDAAIGAGIDTSVFPWKTSMWFKEDGEVSVRAGYGASIEKL